MCDKLKAAKRLYRSKQKSCRLKNGTKKAAISSGVTSGQNVQKSMSGSADLLDAQTS